MEYLIAIQKSTGDKIYHDYVVGISQERGSVFVEWRKGNGNGKTYESVYPEALYDIVRGECEKIRVINTRSGQTIQVLFNVISVSSEAEDRYEVVLFSNGETKKFLKSVRLLMKEDQKPKSKHSVVRSEDKEEAPELRNISVYTKKGNNVVNRFENVVILDNGKSFTIYKDGKKVRVYSLILYRYVESFKDEEPARTLVERIDVKESENVEIYDSNLKTTDFVLATDVAFIDVFRRGFEVFDRSSLKSKEFNNPSSFKIVDKVNEEVSPAPIHDLIKSLAQEVKSEAVRSVRVFLNGNQCAVFPLCKIMFENDETFSIKDLKGEMKEYSYPKKDFKYLVYYPDADLEVKERMLQYERSMYLNKGKDFVNVGSETEMELFYKRKEVKALDSSTGKVKFHVIDVFKTEEHTDFEINYLSLYDVKGKEICRITLDESTEILIKTFK